MTETNRLVFYVAGGIVGMVSLLLVVILPMSFVTLDYYEHFRFGQNDCIVMTDVSLIEDIALKLGFKTPMKEAQIECLLEVMNKRDLMAILPTGYGKSRIYQMAPHVLKEKYGLLKSSCIVVTPLNSIMLDQIKAMNDIGISSCAIDYNCSIAHTYMKDDSDDSDDKEDDSDVEDALLSVPINQIQDGKFSLIYAHPEAILSTKRGEALVRELSRKEIISCIAVDEAHMILEWGADFRKDFAKIGESLLSQFPDIPVMVFTATASPKAQTQLTSSLKLKSPKVVTQNPDRFNIKYSKIVRPPSTNTQEHLEEILLPIIQGLLQKKEEYPLTIVYTDTTIISFAYAFMERSLGENQYVGEPIPENRLFAQYHHHYTERMKKFIVEDLCKENSKIRVVLATVALGMGLNSPHIRHVIHYKPPTSLEKYFQETGRAGRDGMPSYAILYYNNTDIRRNRPGIEQSVIKFCKNDTKCLRSVMLEHFGYKPSENVASGSCCDICDTQKF